MRLLTECAGKVDPGCAFAASFRVCVEEVCADGRGGYNGREVVHGPADGKDPPGPGTGVVECHPDEVVTDDLQREDQIQDDQTVLGL